MISFTLMPMPRKPTPFKSCESCGKQLERKRLPNGDLESLLHFSRKKYCDRQCMAQGFVNRPSKALTWSSTHAKARRLMPKGPCLRCGRLEARDVHHVDGNHMNNALSNLLRICRSCHNREHRQKKFCVICALPHSALGYCELHYQRFKKWGDPLMVKDNQFVPVRREGEANPKKNCGVLGCSRPFHAKGLCGMHLQRERRQE